jgi:hypothetical protein
MNKAQAATIARKRIAGKWTSKNWRVQIQQGFSLELINIPASFSAQISVNTNEQGVAIPGSWYVRTWLDADLRSGFECALGLLDLDSALNIVVQRIERQIVALQAMCL